MDSENLKALYEWLDERLDNLANSQKDSHARLRQDMTSGFQGMNTRLDMLNGRTTRHETDIAVLKDRSERAERQSGIIGSITGGGAAAIVMIIKSMFGK